MKNEQPTTYFNRCYVLVSGLQRLGWGYQQACEALGLPLVKPEADYKIPLSFHTALCARVNALLDDEAACFRLGFNSYPTELGHVIKLSSYAKTLGHGLQYTLYFQRLLNSICEMKLESTNSDLAIIQYRDESLKSQPIDENIHLFEELRLSVFVQQIYLGLGARYQYDEIIKSLSFRHSLIADIEKYQQYSPVKVCFNQAQSGIYFRPGVLTYQVYSHDQDAFEYQLTCLWKVIKTLEADLEIETLLEFYCFTHIPAIEPCLEQFSAEIGKRSAYVNQKLQESGISFLQQVRKVKNEIARCHLQTTNASIKEITQQLGYSSSSSFSQSFKQSFNLTPSQYRSQTRTEDPYESK